MTAVLSPIPYLPVTGGTIAGSLSVTGHLDFVEPPSPTALAGAQAGTSPPAPVVLTGANDNGASMTFGTGTTPAAGIMIAITFSTPWVISGGGNPHIVVSANNNATAPLGLYVSGVSVNGFNISSVNAPAASQGNGTYAVSWVAMG